MDDFTNYEQINRELDEAEELLEEISSTLRHGLDAASQACLDFDLDAWRDEHFIHEKRWCKDGCRLCEGGR